MDPCVSRLLDIINEAKAPLTMEVVKSIASLCREDPYKLWYTLASTPSLSITVAPKQEKRDFQPKARAATHAAEVSKAACWHCPACGKVFNDVRHLVNHITFFVRQGDSAHIEVYRKIKDRSSASGKSFSEVANEELRC